MTAEEAAQPLQNRLAFLYLEELEDWSSSGRMHRARDRVKEKRAIRKSLLAAGIEPLPAPRAIRPPIMRTLSMMMDQSSLIIRQNCEEIDRIAEGEAE